MLSRSDEGEDPPTTPTKIRGALQPLPSAMRTDHPQDSDGFVFATRTGRPPSREISARVSYWRLSSEPTGTLAKDRLPPLPQKLTPHSLRRTFASILYALGEDPGVVMDEMGHTDPALSLRAYRQSMRRGEDEKQALRALVERT